MCGSLCLHRVGDNTNSNIPLTQILRRSNTEYAILCYGNVGRSQIASLQARIMKQEQTQQETQLNSVAREARQGGGEGAEGVQGAVSPARPGRRQVHRCANCDIEFFWSPTIVQ